MGRALNSSVRGFVGSSILLVWVLVGSAAAQSRDESPLVIPQLETGIEVDGRLDERAWQQALHLPLVQHQPDFGAAPSETTEILIGYTADHLFVACRCSDTAPLSAPSVKRDFFTPESDFLVLLLDTYDDNENALVFGTTPTGLRADVAVMNDAAGSPPFDTSWNTFWDATARRGPNGWTAEMGIPVSSLRFRSDDGRVTMGLTAWRLIARRYEEIGFPAIPPNWGALSMFKPSQARTVVFENLHPRPPLRVRPYTVGGIGQRSSLNAEETAFERQTEWTYDVGADLKYGLTSNLTLDLTVNPDFAQVEADDQEVNLSRFPLFFPEKRPFFLERTSNFTFAFSPTSQLFYSRRIGLHRGRPVRVLGGARLVGREGPWDVGVLNMQTARLSASAGPGSGLPSENFGVTRFRRQLINESSYVGAIATSRVGADGTYNLTYGTDAIFFLGSDQYVSAKWAQTFDNEIAPGALFDRTRLQARWENRSYEGFGYELRYDRAGSGYQPGLGFERRSDYVRLGDRISYGWIPSSESRLRRHQLSLEGEAYFRNESGRIESLELGPTWMLNTRSGHSLSFGLSSHLEGLTTPFRLSGVLPVPARQYRFASGSLEYGMPTGRRLRLVAGLEAGSFYDGHRASLTTVPTWNVSSHLRLTGFFHLNRIRFPIRAQTLTTFLSRLRTEWTPNVRYSVLGFIQHHSTRNVIVANVRFRFNPREGTDLYLVYNETLNTDRSGSVPSIPLSSRRAALLKYSRTFDFSGASR